jgi:hypothetical protein
MKKHDLVYILGTGSRWRNNEIRYSLRSVERNLPGHKVFIVGECPTWATSITHIPAADDNKNKLLNARAKYMAAAKDQRISDEFVLMNDDFFVLKPVENIPAYSRGTLAEMLRRHPTQDGYYYKSLKDTKCLLNSMGILNPLDFEIHAPIIFNKEKLITTIELIGTQNAYSIRSCYGNLHNLDPRVTTDFKASNLAEFTHQINRDPAYLSISDAVVAQREFRDWIRRTFPEPSQFETDRGAGSDILPGAPMDCLKFYAKKSFIYNKKIYSTGEIIDGEVMDDLRNDPAMSGCYELK